MRSLGTFLGSRAAQKQQRQAQSQLHVASDQQAQPATAASNANDASAAMNNNTCAAVLPNSDNATAPQEARAAVEDTSNDGNRAVTGHTPSQPSGSIGHNGVHNGAAVGPPSSPVPPGQNSNVRKEEAVSTTEEHTESHQYVKTEHDASGNQQAKAEVVHKKTTTQVHKRKRQECCPGDGSMADIEAGQPNADSSTSSPVRLPAQVSAGSTRRQSLEPQDHTEENVAGLPA